MKFSGGHIKRIAGTDIDIDLFKLHQDAKYGTRNITKEMKELTQYIEKAERVEIEYTPCLETKVAARIRFKIIYDDNFGISLH